MATFTPNLELKQHSITDPIDPADAFGSNFGKISLLYQDGNAVSNGVAVCDRHFANGSITPASGDMYLAYFTSPRGSISGGVVAKAHVRIAAQAASGLSLARIGLYKVNSIDQSLSLVASTANDTTGWTSVFSGVTKNLTAGYTLQVGQRYAVGVLFVGTTPPSCIQAAHSSDYALNAIPPRVCGKLTGQSDLPASVAEASISTSGGGIYAILQQ